MKTIIVLLRFLFVALMVRGCSGLVNLYGSDKVITPSNVTIAEERMVSNFTGIDMRTVGKVMITQGDNESLTISGSDNLVRLVKTTVRGGVLIIEMEDEVNITGMNSDTMLTFTIMLKNLTALTVSGLGGVEIKSLATPELAVTMSGAGQVLLGHLTADSIHITVTGLGNVEVAGNVKQATIDISGAGYMKAPDLSIQTAKITIPGLGNATVWVTGQLTGNISGGGSVSYYGNPQLNTKTTGLGSFHALGSK